MSALAEINIDLNQCNPAYDDFMFSDSRQFVMVGGSGSGKSYAAADKICMRGILEPGHRFVVFRKVAKTLRRSVWPLMQARLSHWGLYERCSFNKTEMTITFPNGSEVWCAGLDDPEKLKSIEGMSSAWIEEATECTPDDINQVNLRLRGDTTGYKQIVYTFNPISVMHHLKARFWDNRPNNCEVLRTTYQDNDYIDEEYKAELESLRDLNPNLHRIYALGEWGTLEGVIYKPYIMDEWPDVGMFHDRWYAVDFGFKNPMTLLGLNAYDGEVYLDELIYESEMTTNDLIVRMESLAVDKHLPMYCDAAEPDRIEELKRAGYKAIPAHKGQGSVRTGIDFCQSITFHSKPDNVNLNAENMSYSWRVDRQGNPMDEPVKMNDHAMDAKRYGVYSHLGRPKQQLATFDRSMLGI